MGGLGKVSLITYMGHYLRCQLVVSQVGHSTLLDGVSNHFLNIAAPAAF